MLPEEFFEGNIILIVIILAASVAASYFLTRWIFSVNESLRKQDKMIELLEKLLAAQAKAAPTKVKKTEKEELRELYECGNITKAQYEMALQELKG